MARYKELSLSEGVKCMNCVWTMAFKPLEDTDYFIGMGGSEALRDCAEFRLSAAQDSPSEIYFFAQDPELTDLLMSSDQLYLFGSYNQMNVCMMRAKGSVSCVADHPEKGEIRERLRISISKRASAESGRLQKDMAELRFKILDEGQLFCFRPDEFAYSGYQRG